MIVESLRKGKNYRGKKMSIEKCMYIKKKPNFTINILCGTIDYKSY